MGAGVLDLGFTRGSKSSPPASLSDKTKAIIEKEKLIANELTGIVLNAINQVNGGSVESLDDLVMKSLEKRRVWNINLTGYMKSL